MGGPVMPRVYIARLDLLYRPPLPSTTAPLGLAAPPIPLLCSLFLELHSTELHITRISLAASSALALA